MCNFVNVYESDAKQEKPVLNFTGEKCGGCGDDDPVYNRGKLKSACVDESDANQEKPAFTVEKCGGCGNDPIYSHGEVRYHYHSYV